MDRPSIRWAISNGVMRFVEAALRGRPRGLAGPGDGAQAKVAAVVRHGQELHAVASLAECGFGKQDREVLSVVAGQREALTDGDDPAVQRGRQVAHAWAASVDRAGELCGQEVGAQVDGGVGAGAVDLGPYRCAGKPRDRAADQLRMGTDAE